MTPINTMKFSNPMTGHLNTDPYLSTVVFNDLAVEFRIVHPTDAQILGDYFLNLSADTKRRYGPHPFDRETAERLCVSTNPEDTLRMIALLGSGASQRVVAYFILILGIRQDDAARYEKLAIPLQAHTDCTLAPSVADDFQAKGLGSALMKRLIEIAKTLGRRRMVLWGGTQATNDRAIHFYHKHGFRTVGEFQEPPGFNNYDMILDL
jgi:GNAT superfamily N-acetyltransferase